MIRAFRAFVAGFRDMMALTSQRGPWAYWCMAEREATTVETARDLGQWVAVVLVRGDDARRALKRATNGAMP